MKFTRPLNQQNPLSTHDRRPSGLPDSIIEQTLDQEALFSVEGESVDAFAYGPPPALDDEASTRFQARLQSGKVRLCPSCGEVMSKTSRMILSPVAGALLLFSGIVLMTCYGLAANFLPTPWYLKFSLPAVYYVGSIFVGVGMLFFFIREKIWFCPGCKDMHKRR